MSVQEAVEAERRLSIKLKELDLVGHWVAVRNHELVAHDISLNALRQHGRHGSPYLHEEDDRTARVGGVNPKADTIFRVRPDVTFF